MTHEERSLIKDLEKCDFGEIHAMHVAKVEARRNMSKEEKLVYLKKKKKILINCMMCRLFICFFWRKSLAMFPWTKIIRIKAQSDLKMPSVDASQKILI